jgi:chemotaxis family two-component system response regulator Rcp1
MGAGSNRGAVEILLVEDNLGDIRLTEELFKECVASNNLRVVRNGEEAMACLRQEGQYAQVPVPHLILLDLNLPKKDGREVLAELKADPELRHIPVVVLTTSSAAEDIVKSYDLHANCYLIKPVQLEEFVAVVKSIESFWLSHVRYPNQGG